MAGAVELRVLQAEVITLLREIKELLQTRNDRMEEILHSATQGHSAEPAESGQAEPPPESIKFGEDSPGIASQRSSSVSDGLASDSSSKPEKSHLKHPSRLDGMDRIRNYQLFVEGQSSRCEDVNATIAGCTLEPKQPGFVAGSNWSYWRGIGRGSGGDHGVCIYEGRGRPNYMPEWEMIQVDGEWNHMDGASLRADIESSPDEEFEEEERLVPYSLAPLVLSKPIGSNNRESPISICLAFEKDALHAVVRDGPPLNSTLDKLRQIWEKLYECGGSFEITDVDDFGHTVWYGWKDFDGNSPPEEEEEEEGDPRTLAGPALSAEEFLVNIWSVRCKLSKRAGAPAAVRRVGATQWYRITSFQALTAILKSKAGISDIDIDQFCSLVFREVDEPSLDPPVRPVPIQRFKDLLEVHVRCKGRSEDENPFEAKWAPFHITWFKIRPNGQRPSYGNWKSGALYGTTKRSGAASYLQEMAFTMSFLPSRIGISNMYYTDDPPVKGLVSDWGDPGFWYWSVLHLAPAHFCSLHQETSWPEGSYDGHMIPVALILQALQDAADSWEQIANHLSSLIDNQGAIFDPEDHDRLLFDDNTFSRSRLYFWAIDCLGMFIPSISARMREWRNFWGARKHIFNFGEGIIREVRQSTGRVVPPWSWQEEGLANLVPLVEDQIARLEALKSRLESMRAQIDTLRNGLFNASAVIESRAATELGENVKLLTYISIVYLPLSFCAALWALDYSYHPVVFTVVTVLLATTTYLVVMNLNNLARLSKEVYQQFRRGIIASMLNDAKWAPTGEAFSQFRPERVNRNPSEWNILLFLVLQLWKRLTGFRFLLRKNAKSADV